MTGNGRWNATVGEVNSVYYRKQYSRIDTTTCFLYLCKYCLQDGMAHRLVRCIHYCKITVRSSAHIDTVDRRESRQIRISELNPRSLSLVVLLCLHSIPSMQVVFEKQRSLNFWKTFGQKRFPIRTKFLGKRLKSFNLFSCNFSEIDRNPADPIRSHNVLTSFWTLHVWQAALCVKRAYKRSAAMTKEVSPFLPRLKGRIVPRAKAHSYEIKFITLSMRRVDLGSIKIRPVMSKIFNHCDRRGDLNSQRQGPRWREQRNNESIFTIMDTLLAEGLNLFALSTERFIFARIAYAVAIRKQTWQERWD